MSFIEIGEVWAGTDGRDDPSISFIMLLLFFFFVLVSVLVSIVLVNSRSRRRCCHGLCPQTSNQSSSSVPTQWVPVLFESVRECSWSLRITRKIFKRVYVQSRP